MYVYSTLLPGLFGHRSPAVVVAIIGVYKAGGAYSMMDPAYPAERVRICMEIADPWGWIRIDGALEEPEVPGLPSPLFVPLVVFFVSMASFLSCVPV